MNKLITITIASIMLVICHRSGYPATLKEAWMLGLWIFSIMTGGFLGFNLGQQIGKFWSQGQLLDPVVFIYLQRWLWCGVIFLWSRFLIG